MSKQIQLDAPSLGAIEKKYISKAIDSGYVSSVGPFIPKFEKKLADYLGSKYSVSTQSGTASLHMALLEIGIQEGDEIIVPNLTFVASVNPILYLKAIPVFIDVDPETWNIDVGSVEAKISKKTKAIVPVHLYGNPCDMKGLLAISKKYKIPIVEDASESLGATFNGQYTGTFGEFGCLSFNGNKLITTGGGGMIVSPKKEKIEHIRYLINQAKETQIYKEFLEVGFNYRMTNIEAALGLAQMDQLTKFLKKKRRFAEIYREELGRLKQIVFQKEYDHSESSYWFNCIKIKGIDIDKLRKNLTGSNIQTRRIFSPLTQFIPYEKYKNGTYKNSLDIYKTGLCLPSSALNSEKDIQFVCETLKKLLR